MRPEFIQDFLKNGERMARFRQAVRTLEDIGIEEIFRYLGEPMPLPVTLERRMEIAAFDHAEKKGWNDCLDYLFQFEEKIGQKTEETTEDSFGTKDILRQHGFSEAEIEKVEI